MNPAWTFTRKVSISIAASVLAVAIIANAFVYVTFKQWTARQEQAMLSLKLEQLATRIGEVQFLPHLLSPGKGKGAGPAAVFSPDLDSLAGELKQGQRLEMIDQGGQVLASIGETADHNENKAGLSVNQSVQLPAFGQITLRLSESGLSMSAEAVRVVGRLLTIATLLAALLAAGAGLLVARTTVAPIRRLIGTVRGIEAGGLSKRVDVPPAQDELRQLADTFNGFLERLEHAFDRQRQFVADASHELKTPIAVIEGHARMMQRWGKSKPEVLEESLGYILDQTKRMGDLTAQLLLAAETETAPQQDADECSDLADTLEQLLPQIEQLNPDIGLDYEPLPGPIAIRMPAARSYQVLRNIIENAWKYTPSGGKVRIRHLEQEGSVFLIVSDTGIGIAKEHLPRVFDRFYRADSSRNRSQGGSGLGLAITKSMMERYGGSIRIDSTEGQGTNVTLRFVSGRGLHVTDL